MIKFKKYLVASMATLMCLSPVFAADTSTDDHSTNLNYTVEQSYKWTAPADITFATNVDTESKPGTVAVIENIIAGNETLKISIASDAVFQIESAEHSIRYYKVLKNSDELSAGSLVLEVPSGTNEATQDLNFVLQGVVNGNTSQIAGTYTGTLNFVANIETTVSVTKGDIVTMSDLGLTDVDANADSTTDTFRVLSVEGSQVKLLAMDSYKSSEFNSSEITTDFNGTTGQKYAGSVLDGEMTNFYNSLPAELQNAIVEQNISQSMYEWSFDTNASANFSAWHKNLFTDATTSGTNYYLTRIAEINVGARKIFALDVDDVINYLGSNSTAKDVNELFFNTRSNKSRYVWLRSAYSGNGIYAFRVNGRNGSLNYDFYDNSYEVRPAFVLDLSLLG